MTLLKLDEPDLLFAHDQPLADPRDGLTLFGPLDEGKPYGIRAGIIGTSAGIKRFTRYIETLQRPIITEHTGITRPYFPGFTAAFRIPWNTTPAATLTIDDAALQQALYIDDRYQRIAQTVDVYAAPLIKNSKEGEARPDVWFVIIPDEVHKYCRPQSTIETAKKIITKPPISRRRARKLRDWPSMFREENEVAAPYQSDPDFHHQLKARLLATNTPTQIIRESTIAPTTFSRRPGNRSGISAASQATSRGTSAAPPSTRAPDGHGSSPTSDPACATSASSTKRTSAARTREQHAAPRNSSWIAGTASSSKERSVLGTPHTVLDTSTSDDTKQQIF
jgi:hypothetical protein